MISVTELRNGAAFTENGQIFLVLTYEHVKLGRGNATIKLKVKNLRGGAITDRTFVSGSKVQEVNLEKKEVTYLYHQGFDYYFMDPVSFEQFSVDQKHIADAGDYLKPDVPVKLLLYGSEALGVEVPLKMEFVVKETEPGVKGNSATNIFKDAILENGIRIKVPLFVTQKDKVRIDTRTGEYVERVSK